MPVRKLRLKQPHEVQHLDGRPINWLKPPKPTTRCRWSKKTITGKRVTGSFRHLCHLNRLNNLALKTYHVELEVIQPAYNKGVEASAGTHDYDATVDVYLPGVSWWVQERFFRANGLGCWYRHPPLFGNHIHGFTLPPLEGRSRGDDFAVAGFKVGKYIDGGFSTAGKEITSSQLVDYYKHAFGLSEQHEPGSDHSWFPKHIGATVFDLGAYVEHRKRNIQRQRAA